MTARCARNAGWLALAGWLAACGAETTAPPDTAGTSSPAVLPIEHDGDWFVDRASESALDFVHSNGMTGSFYQPEMMGPGVGFLDYDDDGDLDVYFVQGGRLGDGEALLAPPPDQPPGDRLFRNDLDTGPGGERRMRFTDVTGEAGIASRGYGMGVAVGDYDNDGWIDIYTTRFGPNQMFRNRGDGTFTDATAETGTGDAGLSVPATFFDYDRDGRLDLFVGNYLHYSIETHWQCYAQSGPADYCPPEVSPPQPDRLYRNRGDGTFADVTFEAGMGREYGPGLGASAADFDNDGWLDLFVANDQQDNQLWINQRDGTFRNRALLWGTAFGATGVAKADMGVDAGDFDNDGDEDLFITELAGQGSTLYVNDGGMFRDESAGRGIRAASLPYTGFGTGWLDVDNDGWLDLIAVNGTVTLDLETYGPDNPFALQQRNQVFRNRGGERFEDVTNRAGAAFALSEVSRGAAFGDVDNDGDTDVLIANGAGPVRLLVNEVGHLREWIGLRLVGRETPRDMLGARVEVVMPDGSTRWRRARADGSYASANDPRVIVGLGEWVGAFSVRVTWPSGAVEEWDGLPSGRYTTLTEGEGRQP